MGSGGVITSMLEPLRVPREPRAVPLVAAHRGAMSDAPENTIEAFDLAVQGGADMIELDVHPTRDGRFAVLHDVSVDRTTRGSGLVQNLTAAEIRELDGRVPMLEDVLAWAIDRAYLNIDVRNYSAFEFYETELTAERIVEAIGSAGLLERVAIQCLDHRLALAVRGCSDQVTVGVTQHGRPVRPASIAKSAGANLISIDSAFATSEFVSSLRDEGIGVMASVEARLPGVRDSGERISEMTQRLIGLSVDVVVADDVEATVKTIQGHLSRTMP